MARQKCLLLSTETEPMLDHEITPIETTVSAAIRSPAQATRLRQASSWQARLPLQRRGAAAFTLAELVVTIGVLVLLVFLATQLLNSTAAITTLSHKRMDADSQAREVLDRMAIDFAQMVKRSDVDYYVKSAAAQPLRNILQPGNDRIAFYSTVPGYFATVPAPAPTFTTKSPVSLVGYRINANSAATSYNKMERLGRGLAWNGFSSTSWTPVVFMPIPLASSLPSPSPTTTPVPTPTPTPEPSATPTPTATPAWPDASSATTAWPDSEVIGPQVFRFEYYYLLKNGTLSDIPWNASANIDVNGMQDVAAIVVDIAVIDPKSRVLLTDAQIATFSTPGNAHFLADYASSMTPGQLRTQWQNKLNGIIDPNSPDFDATMPRSAISGIRFYERYFYLSSPTLVTVINGGNSTPTPTPTPLPP
jgi:hypothetical protein